MLKIFLISFVFIAIAILAIAIKMFFIKGGRFEKSCSSVDAQGKKAPCTCKSTGEDKCENYEVHHKKE